MRCVGTHRQFIKKKRQKICEFPKNFATVILKTIFLP